MPAKTDTPSAAGAREWPRPLPDFLSRRGAAHEAASSQPASTALDGVPHEMHAWHVVLYNNFQIRKVSKQPAVAKLATHQRANAPAVTILMHSAALWLQVSHWTGAMRRTRPAEDAAVRLSQSSGAEHQIRSRLEARGSARTASPLQEAQPKALIHDAPPSRLVGRDLAGHAGGCQSDAFGRIADLYKCTFRAS